MMTPADALKRRPKKVAMVGLGPSANAYWMEVAQWDSLLPWDEVWAINRAATAFQCDLQWNMHDLRELVRTHKMERMRLMDSKVPIVTVTEYPEFPQSVAYPIGEVLEFIKHDILSSTPAYMVAYAMMIGVKEMYLYGMDFHYKNLDRAEEGGQGMAYLLGMAQVLGINYRIPNTSSLLGSYKVHLVRDEQGREQPMRPLYGYATEMDPRVPRGAKIIPLHPQPNLSVVNTPRDQYGFGEAEAGDQPAAAQGA